MSNNFGKNFIIEDKEKRKSLYRFLIIAFLTFHFVTDEGITLIWHAEAGKPYITELFGDFGVLNLVVSFVSLLISFIFFNDKK